MKNEEMNEDQFYQEDFSTATEWEAFVSRLTDYLEDIQVESEENLSIAQLSTCEWTQKTEEALFNNFDLILTRYKAKIEPRSEPSKSLQSQVFIDLNAMDNDYCILDSQLLVRDSFERGQITKQHRVHPIAVYYGLRDFVVIESNNKPILDISQIKLLQSSMSMAVFESKCNIPVFIRVLEEDQNVFLGVYEHGEFKLSFDIIHLISPPPALKYLSGLLDMFKSKIRVAYVNPVMVSVCLSYSLKSFLSATFHSDKKNDSSSDDWDVFDFASTISSLPFGVSSDPVNELILYTKWPHVAENVVFDSPTYSDFNPINAPKWSIRTRFDYTPICYLADLLHEYLTLSDSREALSEYYHFMNVKNRVNENNPLAALAESKKSSNQNAFSADVGASKYVIDGPLSEPQVQKMIEYLFPNENSLYPYKPKETEAYDPLKIKSAHPDSLVHRLSILLANCYSSFSGRRSVAQFWAEFSQKMSHCVENCINIPGVAYGFPDLRSCLLNQKLQMLNICMERRNLREGGLPFSMQEFSLTSPNAKQQMQDKISTSKTDSDDEFFDCVDDKVDDETSSKKSPWSPVGRLSMLGKMLLIDSDEPLYIPVTQDPVPKTEDELEDDAEMLLRLGSDSEFRTQLMSSTLLSDMESFKAANPTAKLDDFIRWYSPRDWIEEDSDERDPFGRIGHLSDRMMIPGNTWQTVWKSAKPVPARRQKRLFDDTKEAEKVLHFFESQTLGQVCQMTVAPLFHTALLRIQKESEHYKDFIPNYKEIAEKLRQLCCTLARDKWNSTNSFSKKKWEIVTNEIANFELKINQVLSIIRKLYPDKTDFSENDKKLLFSLMKCYDTELDEAAKNEIGVRVMYMFNLVKATQSEQRVEDQQWSLPDPIEKQFVLRLSGNTQSQGVGGPQLMRVILQNNNFRVCGAFSRNTTFAYSL